MAVVGDYAYIIQDLLGFKVLNVTDPAEPKEVGRWVPTCGPFKNVEVYEHYAYLCADTSGVRILDVTDLSTPKEIGVYDSPGSALMTFRHGDYLHVADGASGLRIVDITNPEQPVEVGFYDTPGIARELLVRNNYAYIADYTHGLRIIDVSDPTRPVEVGFTLFADVALGVALGGNYAYVGIGKFGLRVVDISDPTHPEEVASNQTVGWVRGVRVSGDYAYLADPSSGLRVVDISNPLQPTQVYRLKLEATGGVLSFQIVDNYAYLAGWYYCRVINLENPTQPYIVGQTNTAGGSTGVAVKGNSLLVAEHYRFRIYDCSQALSAPSDRSASHPESFSLSAYPNPFNSTTTISYQTSTPSDVTVSVYDLSGRVVATLVDGFKQAGSHSVNWNAKNIANGLYIVRIEGNGFSASKKVVLIK